MLTGSWKQHTGSESDMPCAEKKVDDTDEEWGED